jgi:hypothetical protein
MQDNNQKSSELLTAGDGMLTVLNPSFSPLLAPSLTIMSWI